MTEERKNRLVRIQGIISILFEDLKEIYIEEKESVTLNKLDDLTDDIEDVVNIIEEIVEG